MKSTLLEEKECSLIQARTKGGVTPAMREKKIFLTAHPSHRPEKVCGTAHKGGKFIR